ncbi:tectonic-1-like [Watersipora subatra]|uniref:tectonic-1-like n=1 Tax=Watersipora subatra TaxID=2589382 RepID=UPI00355B32AA
MELAFLPFLLSLVSTLSTQTLSGGVNSTSNVTSTLPPSNTTTASSTASSASSPGVVNTLPVVSPLSSANLEANPIPLYTDLAVCTCDLTPSICDINCCCDDECSAMNRLVFSACDDEADAVAVFSNLCSYETKVFNDFSVTTTTVRNPFAFCIWRELNASRHYYNPIELLKTNESFHSFESAYTGYRYSYQYELPSPRTTLANYKSGDTIITLTQLSVGIFYVPTKLGVTNSCIDRNPAKFLHDYSSSCLRNLIKPLRIECEVDISLHAHTLAAQLSDMEVKKRPDAGASAADRLPINITGDTQPPFYNTDQQRCTGVVTEVAFTVQHEAGVLVSVSAHITISDLSGDLTAVEQKYSITYLAAGSTPSTFQRSGNPGYIIGKPLLAGRRVNDYIDLNGDRTQYLTMITASADGDCNSDRLRRTPVLFGQNFRSGCTWKLSDTDVSSCRDLQSDILEALLGPSGSLASDNAIYIASFGNSSVLKAGDWVPVFVVNRMSDKVCVGISAHLEIYYSNVGSLSNPQAMVVGAELFLEYRDLNYVCLGPFCRYQNIQQTQNLEMVTSVAFVDVSQSAKAAIAAKPVTSSKLPPNFFHPYYVSDSTSFHIPFYQLTIIVISVCASYL